MHLRPLLVRRMFCHIIMSLQRLFHGTLLMQQHPLLARRMFYHITVSLLRRLHCPVLLQHRPLLERRMFYHIIMSLHRLFHGTLQSRFRASGFYICLPVPNGDQALLLFFAN